MRALYRDVAQSLVTVILAAGEVLSGETGPGTWHLGAAASADFAAGAAAPIAPYAPPYTGARLRSGRAIRYALNQLRVHDAWAASAANQAKAGKPDDYDYWDTLGAGDLAPEDNPKLVRIAAGAQPPIDVKAVFDAAPAPP